jgi:hypothetical protein
MLAEYAVQRVMGREGVRSAGGRFIATAGTIAAYVEHVGRPRSAIPTRPATWAATICLQICRAVGDPSAPSRTCTGWVYDRSNLAMIARAAQDQFVRDGRAKLRKIKNRFRPEVVCDAGLALAARNHSASLTRLSLNNPPLDGRDRGCRRRVRTTYADQTVDARRASRTRCV